jgi:hypothetical protein
MEIEQMQMFINNIEHGFGRTNSGLRVMQTTDQRFAYASGFNILGIHLIGNINVDMQSLRPDVFTDPEIQFILSHEYTHIFKNHAVANILSSGLEIVLRGPNNERSNLGDLARSVVLPGLLTSQECEADLGAFQITHNLDFAISCLSKLVSGRLEQPSHTWELREIDIPAMTMGQRITELRSRALLGGPSIFI